MPKTIITANAPVDEGSQNAATATTSNSETTTGDTEDTQKQAATATNETLADVEGTSEDSGFDWKASSRKWERLSKENLRRVEELTEKINASDATVEELRAQVATYEHAAQVDEWKAQVAAELGVKVEALRGDTLEDLTAHGKVLKAAYPEPETATAPQQDSGAGYYPNRSSALSLDDQITAAEKAGEHKLAASLKAAKLAQLTR